MLDSAALSKSVAPRLLVMHLMMSMMDHFDSVMVKHFVKGMSRRIIAHRLIRRLSYCEYFALPFAQGNYQIDPPLIVRLNIIIVLFLVVM